MASRRERAAQVSLLKAEGASTSEIQKRLGISDSYIYELLSDPDGIRSRQRKESYRRPCPQCGKLMSGHDGNGKKAPKLCQNCDTQERKKNKRWTKQAVIEAIQLFAERNGRPPLAPEWARPKAIRGEEYPPLSACYSHNGVTSRGDHPFASWADAIEQAGFPRPLQGHKVFPRGQGVDRMDKEWIVFFKEDKNKWSSYEVKSSTRELAINKAAFREGEYFAVQKKVLNVRTVEPTVVYQVMPSTPGGND